MGSSSSSSSSSSSIFTSSSSSSLSSFHSKAARVRTLPRRGQIKAQIFASVFASIARCLRAQTPQGSRDAANSPDGAGSRTPMSDFRMDVDESGCFGLSVRSSPPGSIVSGSITRNSPSKPLSRPRSFHGGMHGTG